MTMTATKETPFNPATIRNYHFIRMPDKTIKVQFVAIGDKHRMMKQDDGSIVVVKEPEQGKPYRYGAPVPVNEAVSILEEGHYVTHADIAKHIRDNADKL